MPSGKMDVNHRFPQIGVAQQKLNRAQVGAGFQQVGGEAVPEGLLVLLMICTRQRSAIAFIHSMA